eukprot:827088-Pyramimonas_sp.AAC.1
MRPVAASRASWHPRLLGLVAASPFGVHWRPARGRLQRPFTGGRDGSESSERARSLSSLGAPRPVTHTGHARHAQNMLYSRLLAPMPMPMSYGKPRCDHALQSSLPGPLGVSARENSRGWIPETK